MDSFNLGLTLKATWIGLIAVNTKNHNSLTWCIAIDVMDAANREGFSFLIEREPQRAHVSQFSSSSHTPSAKNAATSGSVGDMKSLWKQVAVRRLEKIEHFVGVLATCAVEATEVISGRISPSYSKEQDGSNMAQFCCFKVQFFWWHRPITSPCFYF